MKTNSIITLVVCMLLLTVSCNNGPQAIDYGNDGCKFCKMTVVDKIHGAEIITAKGKVFKFDATECMINYLNEEKELEIGSLLTNYYESPTKFITTQDATFLISKNLPSPMGAYLTAFETKETAEKIVAEKGGALYNWEELQAYLKAQ